MKCRTVQRRLGAYLDGELAARARADVETHLRACQACAAELEREEALRRLLGLSPAPAAPEGFVRSVLEKGLGRRRVERQRVFALPRMPVPALSRVAAAAAVVLGIALGGLLGVSVVRLRVAGLAASGQQRESDLSVSLLEPVPSDSVSEAYLELIGELN